MRSIDNLREYALTAASVNATTRAVLAGYVDEIEREVADMVPLPVDADGVPIHVGDVMEWCDSGETLAVQGIGYDILFYIDGENAEWTAARNKRHHHAPTVEDVLREYADKWLEGGCDDDGIIAEYAAKLRLAGDDA